MKRLGGGNGHLFARKRIATRYGYMSHLALRAKFLLAVKVDVGMRPHRPSEVGHWDRTRVRPDHIDHDGGRHDRVGTAQWKSEHRADVVFKLTRSARFDGVMSGVMRTWGEFIHDQFARCRFEQFDPKHPYEINRLGTSDR